MLIEDLQRANTEPSRAYYSQVPVYLIALGAFSLGMASYITAGLIPQVEAGFSVSAGVAVQLVTAFTLAYAVGSPLVVAMLPAQRRRSGLLIALSVFVLANAVSALADSFAALLAFRALAGVGAGVYLAVGIGTATALQPNRREKAIAVIMGFMAAGVVLGVPLGLMLAEQAGWEAAFWLIALLGGVSLVGLLHLLPAVPGAVASPLGRKLQLLADREVVGILAVSLLAAIASLGMYTFIAPLLASLDESESLARYLWIWGIGGVLGSFLAGPLTERLGARKTTLVIMLLLSAALLLLPAMVVQSSGLLMLVMAIWGAVGWALQVPQNSELLKVQGTGEEGNLAVALNESALYFGSAVGAGAGGLLLLLGMPVWTLAVLAGLLAALGALLQQRLRR